jgi:uncharacterized protein
MRVPSDVTVDSNNYNDILNTPSVSSSEKIYDFADLYTDSEEKDLFSYISDYIKNTNIDVCIVTTNNLNGFGISDYAYNFYDYNDFLEEGVVFVISVANTEPEIFMGNSGKSDGDVFTIYSDSRINQTLAYVYKDIASGNYYTASLNYIKILDGFYSKDRGGNYRVDEDGNIVKEIPWIEIVILALAITFIIVLIFIYKLTNNGKFSYKNILEEKLNSKTLMVKNNGDVLIDSVITKEK